MDIDTIGIMFARSDNGEFPTVEEMAQSRSNWMNPYMVDTAPFASWLVITYDPRGQSYGEDDHRAMDVTNYAAILDNITDSESIPRVSNELRYDYSWEDINVSEALARGIAFLSAGRTFLIVAPPVWEVFDTVSAGVIYRTANEALARDIAYLSPRTDYESVQADTLDTMRDLSRALSDYPLLDEGAYSELEYEAWQEYAPDAWRDELRRADLSDDMLDRLEDVETGDMLNVLADGLHHYAGFTGEYGPSFLDILRDKLLHRDAAVCDLLDYCRNGGGLHNPDTRCSVPTCTRNLAPGQGSLSV